MADDATHMLQSEEDPEAPGREGGDEQLEQPEAQAQAQDGGFVAEPAGDHGHEAEGGGNLENGDVEVAEPGPEENGAPRLPSQPQQAQQDVPIDATTDGSVEDVAAVSSNATGSDRHPVSAVSGGGTQTSPRGHGQQFPLLDSDADGWTHGSQDQDHSDSDYRTSASNPHTGQGYRMPEQLKVKVQNENGEEEEVVVTIERLDKPQKTFIGGFRNKLTGVEYHHACAQTRPIRRKSKVVQVSSETQTVTQAHFNGQTRQDAATQMPKIGYWMSNDRDKILIPGRYQPADELFAIRLEAILVIQRAFRRYKARQYALSLRKNKEAYDLWNKENAEKRGQERQDRVRREYERRMQPKTKADFDNLYAALEKWRVKHVDDIDSTLGGPDRKVALYGLLEKEAQLVAAIGRHKINIQEEKEKERIAKYLEETAQPKSWTSYNGKKTEMDTDATVRARQLKEMYEQLTAPIETYNQRLEVLLLVKCTVKEHDCKLTREILEQIARETECISRGMKASMMEGMRKRIAVLFLQYVRNPEFNPRADACNKVPKDPKRLLHNVYYCPSCCHYLPSTEFEINTTTKSVGRCKLCKKLDNDARTREDLAHYRYLLQELRRRELLHEDNAKVAFIVQVDDIRYLTDNIWKCKSALSQESDPFELFFERWDTSKEWTPWNCILLTKEEASDHRSATNVNDVYGVGLCQSVRKLHIEALAHFRSVPGFAGYLAKNKVKIGQL